MTEEKRFDTAKNPLILQVKFEEIQQYTHKALMQFPKNERFLLCADIKNAVDLTMHLIIRMKKKYTKKTTLQDIDIELDYLRTLIRNAYSFGYIDNHRRFVWIGKIDEAGRIVGGLMKHFAGPTGKA